MIHIQQCALRSFKQQISTLGVCLVQLQRHIGHHRQNFFGISHGFLVNRFEVNGRRMQDVRQDMVMQLQVLAQLGCKTIRMFEILHTQCATCDFVFVSWTNSTSSRSNLGSASFFFGSFTCNIDRSMVGKNQRTGFTDAQA